MRLNLCFDRFSSSLFSFVDTGNIDDTVNEMNVILSNIAEKYTKNELTKTVMCDYCRNGKRRNLTTSVTRENPWITDECKRLHIDYKSTVLSSSSATYPYTGRFTHIQDVTDTFISGFNVLC
jgi:cellulase/cellobiase CelA1